MKTIADLVNDLFATHRKRDGREYSNSEVSRALGGKFDDSYFSKLRKGKIPNPGRDALLGLCQFFNVSPNYFFPELPSVPNAHTDEAGVFHVTLRSTDLNPDVQKKLSELLQALQGPQSEEGRNE